MYMMNKCAKFHKDSPSDKKVKFNLPSVIELSDTADFVYNFVQKPYASEQLRWHIWPTFLLNFFMKFSQKMPLYIFYTMMQKSQKRPKTQMGPVRMRHRSHDFGWQSSHSVDLAGWQAKMASIEIWIPWRNAHKPHQGGGVLP